MLVKAAMTEWLATAEPDCAPHRPVCRQRQSTGRDRAFIDRWANYRSQL
jgi:hypothetical protein